MKTSSMIFAAASALAILIFSGCGQVGEQTPSDSRASSDSICLIKNYTTEIPRTMWPVLDEGRFISFEIVSEGDDDAYTIGYSTIINGVKTDHALFSDDRQQLERWEGTVGYSFLMTGKFFRGDVTLNYGSYKDSATKSRNALMLEIPGRQDWKGVSFATRMEGFGSELNKGEGCILAYYWGWFSDEEPPLDDGASTRLFEYKTVDEFAQDPDIRRLSFCLVYYIENSMEVGHERQL
ncbi:MAG: hypothetical protein FWG42_01740 [Clostridiales bacterium]|nr:hypothetical protein [Clostridiales bacterium]